MRRRAGLWAVAALAAGCLASRARGQGEPKPSAPRADFPASLPSLSKAFDRYDVVLEPDTDAPDWWAGAPSVVRAPDGTFWLAARMRTADGPRGLRGYEIRILKSADGLRFEKALSIRREDVPIPGFERPALLIDPATKRFKLYVCGPWKEGPWSILKFDDADFPEKFDPKSARPVISPLPPRDDRDVLPVEYKDPVIIHAGGVYHCYVIGYMRRNERIYHFTSADGEGWEPVGSPYESVMQLDGWHDFFVRPASLLPIGVGHLFVYEGSSVKWPDPVYNIATGLGFTFDLRRVQDLTPDAPLLASSTPSDRFATLRYSSWLWVGDEIWIYAEAARPNGSNEIRRFRVPSRD